MIRTAHSPTARPSRPVSPGFLITVLGAATCLWLARPGFAANECGAPVANQVVCSAADNASFSPGGITYNPADSLSVDVEDGVVIDTTGDGVPALGITATGEAIVLDIGDAAITTQGFNASGFSVTGATDVTAYFEGTISTAGATSRPILFFVNTGDVTVTNAGSLSGTGVNTQGIGVINTTGLVTIDTSGPITMTGSLSEAIRVRLAASGAIVNVSGAVSGGWGATGSGIRIFDTTVASEINVSSDGRLGALSDLAISDADAALTINNAGEITGYVSLGAGDDVFNNLSGGVWELRNHADTDGDLIRDTEATASADFGADTDSVVNEGILRLAQVSSAGSVGELINLETFTHRGVIDLADGEPNDQLSISGEFQSDGGSLELDGQLDSSVTQEADLLVLDTVTMPNGEPTVVYVANTGAQYGSTTGNGILLIDTNLSPDGAFELGERIIAGAYEYELNEVSEDWYLSSSVFSGAAEYPALVSAALDGWRADIGSLHRRLHALSEAHRAPHIEPASSHGPYQALGPWVQLVAARQTVDTSAGYDQTVARLQIGIDGEVEHVENGRLIFGGFAGSGKADQEFQSSESEASADAVFAGVHGSYISGPFYGQAIGKFEHQDAHLQSVATDANGAPYEVDLLGASLEAGYRFETPSLWIVPHSRLSFAHAEAGSFEDAAGSPVNLTDGQSLHGELALSFGQSFGHAGTLGLLALDVGVRHEFMGEQEAKVSGLTLTHELPDTAGFVAGDVKIDLLDRWLSLGLHGEYAKGDETQELNAAFSLNISL